jgi:hypothetical protein
MFKTWKQHIVKKRKQVSITMKQLNWLLRRKSNLAIVNKLLIYKTIIIHIWTYGLDFEAMVVTAPWYVSNATLHADLGIPYVQDVIQQTPHYTRNPRKPAPQNTTGKRRKQTT